MKKIIYIDTETTGLDAKKGALTEIACIVEINGIEVDKLSLHINPLSYNKEVEVSQEALEVTGKTIEDIVSYGDSKAQFNKFIVFLSRHIDQYNKKDKFKINGYNTKFDVGFLKEWFLDNDNKYYGAYFDYKELDVFVLVGYLRHLGFIDAENDKLKTICDYFKIELDPHKAFDDIVATKKLGNLLTERYIGETDRLAALEKHILDYFLHNGFKLKEEQTDNDTSWFFEVEINSIHKDKHLEFNFYVWSDKGYASGWKKTNTLTFSRETTKEMFDKAFEHFQRDCSADIEKNSC